MQTREGWQSRELRERYGLKKTRSKSRPCFESHAVDSWVLAACVSGAEQPSCTRVWYIVPAILHRLQACKGRLRKPYGGTRSLSLKRGTLVWHKKYGLTTIGGFDRKKQTVSLHDYRSNKRLTQGAKVEACRVLTWVAFRAFLVAEKHMSSQGKGSQPSQAPKKERLFPPRG